MVVYSSRFILLIVLVILSGLHSTIGLRFVIDRDECFSHSVPYEGDKVHVSFVVIKSDTPWHYGDDGVDLVMVHISSGLFKVKIHPDFDPKKRVQYGKACWKCEIHQVWCTGIWQENYTEMGPVKGPTGDQIYDARDKTSDKFEFIVQRKGVHRFCFTNKSPYHETVDFDVHIGHFSYFDEHAKDEHLNPLLEQIGKLEEALYNIQFEQHWLEAQTDRQALVNEGMSRRAIHKALFESAALVGASVLQVYLLRRLFERKLGTSRV